MTASEMILDPASGSPVDKKPHSHGAVVPESSRAEWFTSYDVNAFEVPTGREEIWRFTPMKRLAGLHTGVDDGHQLPLPAAVLPVQARRPSVRHAALSFRLGATRTLPR